MSDLFPATPLFPPLLSALLWAAVQVTAVTAAAAGLHAVARRAGPRAGGRVALLGLCAGGRAEFGGPQPVAAVGRRGNGPPCRRPPPRRWSRNGADETVVAGELSDVSLAAARAFVAALIDPPADLAVPAAGGGDEENA